VGVGWGWGGRVALQWLAHRSLINLVCHCDYGQVYLLPDIENVGRFGGRGNAKCRFNFSSAGGYLCFTPAGHLLVAEGDNQRVQAVRVRYIVEDKGLAITFEVAFSALLEWSGVCVTSFRNTAMTADVAWLCVDDVSVGLLRRRIQPGLPPSCHRQPSCRGCV
jgi:hypothetical protein